MGKRDSIISSPDGDRWRVRRRWMDRPPPDLRRRFRRNRDESNGPDWPDLLWLPDIEGGMGALAIAAAVAVIAVLVVFVLLPLLGVLLELLLLFLLLTSGVLGRVFLRRPWTVEARNLDDPERSVAYAATGFRPSGRAVEELTRAIETSGPPERLSDAVPTTSPRPRPRE
jgi:hypothetical protein